MPRKRDARQQKGGAEENYPGPALPGKLADCSGSDIMASELFLVEEIPQRGSAKQARDREYQAVMPLRGRF